MTRAELRVLLDQHFLCGCGRPELAVAALLRLLRLLPAYTHLPDLDVLIPDEGLRLLLWYLLYKADLTEHGSSIQGSWLSARGRLVLEALTREEADNFEALLDPHCACGYNLDDTTHECGE